MRQSGRAPNGEILWLCLCDCGELLECTGSRLRSGNTKSCGCLHREQALTINASHGHCKGRKLSLTYSSWKAALNRCHNPKATRYRWYGAKGVRVCDKWHDFQQFVTDMGERPSAAHVLSRNNDFGDYEPGNAAWKPSLDNLKEMLSRR